MNVTNANRNLEPADCRIDVHYLHLSPSDQPIIEQELSILSLSEHEHIRRLRRSADRFSYARAHILLRRTLEQHLDYPASQLQFSRTSAGKPFLSMPAGLPALEFNLTHCESMVACAISHMPVGIDVEPNHRIFDFDTIRHVLHVSELRALEGLEVHVRTKLALQFWTCKESALKAIGIGLLVEPNEVVVNLEENTLPFAQLFSKSEASPTRIELFPNQLPNSGHVLSIACLNTFRPPIVLHACK
jgi:4'-phosphopantetheinyl transferase